MKENSNILSRIQKYTSLFIISPFNSVIDGLRLYLRNVIIDNPNSHIDKFNSWINSSAGTVHKFQGKEADEVIFLLGCDKEQKHRFAVTSFVNSNIVNVAVTRAKYRLYIIGDRDVWCNNQYIKGTMKILSQYNTGTV